MNQLRSNLDHLVRSGVLGLVDLVAGSSTGRVGVPLYKGPRSGAEMIRPVAALETRVPNDERCRIEGRTVLLTVPGELKLPEFLVIPDSPERLGWVVVPEKQKVV